MNIPVGLASLVLIAEKLATDLCTTFLRGVFARELAYYGIQIRFINLQIWGDPTDSLPSPPMVLLLPFAEPRSKAQMKDSSPHHNGRWWGKVVYVSSYKNTLVIKSKICLLTFSWNALKYFSRSYWRMLYTRTRSNPNRGRYDDQDTGASRQKGGEGILRMMRIKIPGQWLSCGPGRNLP